MVEENKEEKTPLAKEAVQSPKNEIEILQKQLAECQKQKDEYLAGWQRARADFLNHKKEELERLESFLRHAEEEFILRLLPILDNFNLAEKLSEQLKPEKGTEEKDLSDYEKSLQGFLQIKRQLEELIKTHEVEEIKTAGEKFDPNFHEAIEQLNVKETASGTIVEEIQKGYKINDRVLRPARVKVAK